jgi:hypothetical protein
VPGNTATYPAAAMQRALTIPSNNSQEFFRLRLATP